MEITKPKITITQPVQPDATLTPEFELLVNTEINLWADTKDVSILGFIIKGEIPEKKFSYSIRYYYEITLSPEEVIDKAKITELYEQSIGHYLNAYKTDNRIATNIRCYNTPEVSKSILSEIDKNLERHDEIRKIKQGIN